MSDLWEYLMNSSCPVQNQIQILHYTKLAYSVSTCAYYVK